MRFFVITQQLPKFVDVERVDEVQLVQFPNVIVVRSVELSAFVADALLQLFRSRLVLSPFRFVVLRLVTSRVIGVFLLRFAHVAQRLKKNRNERFPFHSSTRPRRHFTLRCSPSNRRFSSSTNFFESLFSSINVLRCPSRTVRRKFSA